MPKPQVLISGRCVRVISSVTKDGVEAVFGLTLTLPEVKSLIERLSFAAVEIEQQEPAPTPPAPAQPGKLLVLPSPKKKRKS